MCVVVLCYVKLIVGIMLIVTGFLSFGGTFEFIILPIYVILFGILIAVFAFFIPGILGGQIIFYYVSVLFFFCIFSIFLKNVFDFLGLTRRITLHKTQ